MKGSTVHSSQTQWFTTTQHEGKKEIKLDFDKRDERQICWTLGTFK